MEIDYTFRKFQHNNYTFEYKIVNYDSDEEKINTLSVIRYFLKEFNLKEINFFTNDVNIWFVNFFSFYLTEYYIKKRKDNYYKDDLLFEQHTIYFKLYMTLHQLEFMFKKLKIIIDSKNIYGWIDKEISKNSEIIKNKYLLDILSDDLKIKYNYLIQAKNFDLI